MDLTFEMDSFTEKLLERTKKREEFLKHISKINDLNNDQDNDKKNNSSFNKNIDNEMVDLKKNQFTPTESGSCIVPKSGLKRLPALKSKDDSKFDNSLNINSPYVKNNIENIKASVCMMHVKEESNIKSPKEMKTRLAQLAQDYTQQEDDYRSPISKFNIPSPKKITFLEREKKFNTSTITYPRPYRSNPSSTSLTPKSLGAKIWDKSMINLLQNYGFQQSNSGKKMTLKLDKQEESEETVTFKLTNECKNTKKVENKEEIDYKNLSESTELSSINSKLAPFQPQSQSAKINYHSSSNIENDDPSCLPLSARQALFEKKINSSSHQLENLPLSCKVRLFEAHADTHVSSYEPGEKILKVGKSKLDRTKDLFQDKQISGNKNEINFEVPFLNLKPNSQTSSINKSEKQYTSQIKVNDSENNVLKELLPKSPTKKEEKNFGSIENVDEFESPQCSTTRLYPELPSFDETLNCVPKTLKLKTNMEVYLSPIKETGSEKSSFKSNTPLRTLSMYRREQKLLACREKKVIQIENSDSENNDEKKKVEKQAKFSEDLKKKIKDLQLETEKYNKIIEQSLRALSHCIKTQNSSERIEAEKILLINMKKREAIVNYINNIKVEKNFNEENEILGCFNITKMHVELRGEFLVYLIEKLDPEKHYFICVFTCGYQVIATHIISSFRASDEAVLRFHSRIFFDQLPSNFKIKMEVFCLSLPRTEAVEKKRLSLTPKFMSKHKSYSSSSKKLKSRPISSNFQLLACYIFNRHNCYQKSYNLKNCCRSKETPLQNVFSLEMTLGAKYNVNYKCYLNFKEQTGEFLVWNRKWCVLDGYLLYFWRYYEDEDSKPPLGVINFKECVNFKISKASSNISMRENCFAFVTVSKKDSNLIKCHLLAADLKSEFDKWLEKLNYVLEHVRIWEVDAPTPWDQLRLQEYMYK